MQYSSGLQRYFNEHIHLPNTFFDNPYDLSNTPSWRKAT